MIFDTEIRKKTQILTSFASNCRERLLKSNPEKHSEKHIGTLHKNLLLCRIGEQQEKNQTKNKKKWGNVGENGEKSLPLHIEEFFIVKYA